VKREHQQVALKNSRNIDLSSFLKVETYMFQWDFKANAYSTDAVSVAESCKDDTGSRAKNDIWPTRYLTLDLESPESESPATTVTTGKWIKICHIQYARSFHVNIYKRINQHCLASF